METAKRMIIDNICSLTSWIKCSNCGGGFGKSGNYCKHCGAKFEEDNNFKIEEVNGEGNRNDRLLNPKTSSVINITKKQ